MLKVSQKSGERLCFLLTSSIHRPFQFRAQMHSIQQVVALLGLVFSSQNNMQSFTQQSFSLCAQVNAHSCGCAATAPLSHASQAQLSCCSLCQRSCMSSTTSALSQTDHSFYSVEQSCCLSCQHSRMSDCFKINFAASMQL